MVVKAILVLLVVSLAGCVFAQGPSEANGHEIAVKWAIHGEDEKCHRSEVMVEYEGRDFVLRPTERGVFVTPELESASGHSDGKVTIHARCDDFSLDFPDVDAATLGQDYWEFGVDYPPYVHVGGHMVPERGTWASYMIWGAWEQLVINDEPFAGLRDEIANRRPDSFDYDRYDDAYAKAVLGIEYTKNRDLLLGEFERCAKQNEFVLGECGSSLGEYVINLYWRGDDTLLQPMLDAAADKPATGGGDVLLELGWFYARLLSRKPVLAVQRLEHLPVEKREIICRQAGEDEFRSQPSSRTEPVGSALSALGAVGQQCWSVAAKAASRPYGN
jgi:hypothetical protein